MQNITFQNISISGIPYNKILQVNIAHNVGEHAYAGLELEVAKATGADFIKRADESIGVTINTSAEGQHPVLFAGYIQNISLQEMSDYSVLNVNLISASYKLDIQKKQRSFQNTQSTYGDIMEQAAEGKATITVTASDKATNGFVMQYSETDWTFIKRMASQLQAPIFVNIDSFVPMIFVGTPVRIGQFSYTTTNMMSSSAFMPNKSTPLMNPSFAFGKKTTEAAAATNSVQNEIYSYIGEKMNVNGVNYTIGSVSCSMELGVLQCSYGLGTGDNFKCVVSTNNQLAGRMFMGEVKAVKGDQVKVHFTGLDDSYDEGGDKWFPYSTAYSSSDGSGFYCMPEEGDTVRVFIPSNNENDAFVASSVNSNPQSNTRDKSWKAPGGKEILLADDGIYIICEGEKIYINLSTDKGIEIHSDKPINITSDADVIMQAGGEIRMTAKTCINLAVGNSSVYIDNAQIQMGAEGVYIN